MAEKTLGRFIDADVLGVGEFIRKSSHYSQASDEPHDSGE